MGKYKGLFWPAILGVKHMPKVKESEFYNVAGGFRRATINDKIAFFLQHPVWEGRPELFMKTGSPKEIYAMSGMSVHGLCNLIGAARTGAEHRGWFQLCRGAERAEKGAFHQRALCGG